LSAPAGPGRFLGMTDRIAARLFDSRMPFPFADVYICAFRKLRSVSDQMCSTFDQVCAVWVTTTSALLALPAHKAAVISVSGWGAHTSANNREPTA